MRIGRSLWLAVALALSGGIQAAAAQAPLKLTQRIATWFPAPAVAK